MLTSLHKTPFPWFGGKADAAVAVWDALGDVSHYVEPFAGSLAVLLRRPHPCNRTYHSETVNDLDGYLVNVWRAIQQHPDATAEYCSYPVTEADVMARHLWLLKWKDEAMVERLMADPDFCDPKAAGYWLYGCCAWIGGGWCDGNGAWVVGDDGRIVKRQDKEPGVRRGLPHVSDNDMGVHRPQVREPGVGDFHPMTMPELRRWFEFLSARLRHVRILNGDWKRAATSGVCKMLEVRMKGGKAGIFLDPPYSTAANRAEVYACDDFGVADQVRAWCLKNGDDPDYRVILAGFDGEHNILEQHGWRAVEWFKAGFLKGGMAQQKVGGTHQQGRERLWLSPHCLGVADQAQVDMFEVAA